MVQVLCWSQSRSVSPSLSRAAEGPSSLGHSELQKPIDQWLIFWETVVCQRIFHTLLAVLLIVNNCNKYSGNCICALRALCSHPAGHPQSTGATASHQHQNHHRLLKHLLGVFPPACSRYTGVMLLLLYSSTKYFTWATTQFFWEAECNNYSCSYGHLWPVPLNPWAGLNWHCLKQGADS